MSTVIVDGSRFPYFVASHGGGMTNLLIGLELLQPGFHRCRKPASPSRSADVAADEETRR